MWINRYFDLKSSPVLFSCQSFTEVLLLIMLSENRDDFKTRRCLKNSDTDKDCLNWSLAALNKDVSSFDNVFQKAPGSSTHCVPIFYSWMAPLFLFLHFFINPPLQFLILTSHFLQSLLLFYQTSRSISVK